MRLFVDTADLNEIAEWADDDWVSGFTTNPTLMRWVDDGHDGLHYKIHLDAMGWAEKAVEAAQGKPISIDGPEAVWDLGPNVWRKVIGPRNYYAQPRIHNYTAVCTVQQVEELADVGPMAEDIISVFAGRIMDTGRDPYLVLNAAKDTGAQVLWASVREPYNIVQAEQAGCDIITVPPAILRKYLDWHGLPLETVAARTIAQFDKDREGLWTR